LPEPGLGVVGRYLFSARHADLGERVGDDLPGLRDGIGVHVIGATAVCAVNDGARSAELSGVLVSARSS